MNQEQLHQLHREAALIRLDLLRTFGTGKAHHFGGTLSAVDIVTALYFHTMNYSKSNYQAKERDRLIFSKGHSVPVQYVALAHLGIHEVGTLKGIKTMGSVFQGHPDMRKTAGIEAPTGSLGQGLSFANGIALALKADGLESRTFVITGDGELQEGQIWEAAMTTPHYKLGNVCVIVDRNGYQSQGSIDSLMGVEPLEQKFEAFGWKTHRVDGHDIEELCRVLDTVGKDRDVPTAIIADTVKGKGVSFMEGTHTYHNYALSDEQFGKAEAELLAILQMYADAKEGV